MSTVDGTLADAAHDDVSSGQPTAASQPRAGGPGPLEPVVRGEARRAYLAHATSGYLLYSVGASTAFIAVALGLTDAQAGLHSSALAVGIIVAGIAGASAERRIGDRTSRYLAAAAFAVASLVLVTAPALPFTLAGALAIGLGVGIVLAYVNRTLAAGGGPLGRLRLARSAVLSMTSALSVSLVVALGVASGIGWQILVIPAMVLIGALVLATRSAAAGLPPDLDHLGRLPRAYWVGWTLAVLMVALEFSVVFWASSMAVERTGVELARAAFVLTAFLSGVVAARVSLSHPILGQVRPWRVLRAAAALVLGATLVVWATTSFAVALLSFLLAGIGVGAVFPAMASTIMSFAPGQARLASARLVLAVGTAVLTAPFLLGVLADLVDVTSAWLIVPVIAIAILAISVPVARLATSPG